MAYRTTDGDPDRSVNVGSTSCHIGPCRRFAMVFRDCGKVSARTYPDNPPAGRAIPEEMQHNDKAQNYDHRGDLGRSRNHRRCPYRGCPTCRRGIDPLNLNRGNRAADLRDGGHQANGISEELLTGDVATQVEAAVIAEYPDATIQRLETDAEGTYEAHIEQADGTRATVKLDESFAITGTETGGAGGPRGDRVDDDATGTDGSTTSGT
jgi:hypothetical protein